MRRRADTKGDRYTDRCVGSTAPPSRAREGSSALCSVCTHAVCGPCLADQHLMQMLHQRDMPCFGPPFNAMTLQRALRSDGHPSLFRAPFPKCSLLAASGLLVITGVIDRARHLDVCVCAHFLRVVVEL